MQNLSLKLFNSAIKSSNVRPFDEINRASMKLGYIIEQEACSKEVLNWVQSNHRNVNSTFYKTWEDVTSKSRFELLLDQIRHYASTYGTNFQGEVFLPEGTITLPELKSFKVIKAITKEEVIQRCVNMLYAGVALSSDTIEDILCLLDNLGDYSLNIDLVKNKEAKMYLCEKLDIVPTEPIEMVRYLVYRAIGKTMLIKDRATLTAIQQSCPNLTNVINKCGVENLASVFYRFKP